MRRTLRALALIIGAGLLLTSCAPKSAKLIGIAKFVSHPALDAIEKGIQDELADSKPDYKIDLQNANADMNTAAQIAQHFKQEKVALAVGIATPTAQALANQIKDRPVIYAAVTDPVAAGLVAGMDKGGANITGTSDMTPVREQLDLLRSLKPSVKRVGNIYASGEANSVSIASIVKSYCEENGLEYVETTITNSSEARQALLSIADRIDGLYLGNDNTVFSALSGIADVALEKKIPVVTADPSSAETIPVLAALGYDYYRMGVATGKIIVRVLNGEKTENIPAFLPKESQDMTFVLNLDTAKQLGLTVDQSVQDKAKVIISDGQLTRK
ncbi:MAG TPA: ABC transporter substrate-binding protein [Spirochaetales bacterium]|jgi:putative ABC transport system substrate-binding protein|nr:ABC transporter substrate-binding protein [Spirochaetales bacterium]HPS15045.1 ABC transporter substrate-binding protein [Spirochaetales bacterium]